MSALTLSHTQETATGLLAGTAIMTLRGTVNVEDLTAGDRIITRSGACVLQNVQSAVQTLRPIRIAAHTLGCSRPETAMRLAPGQKVLVRDWRAQVLFGQDSATVPVSRLIDGEHIAWADHAEDLTTYHLQFDDAEVFYADGVEVASAPALAHGDHLQAA